MLSNIKGLSKVYYQNLNKDDDIIETIIEFAKKIKIKKANIIVSGSVKNPILNINNDKTKKTVLKKYKISMHILAIAGQLYQKNGKPQLKLHATLMKNASDIISGEIVAPTQMFNGFFLLFC